MKVKKRELIESTARASGCTQAQVRMVFEAAANEARMAVSRGETVMLFGLGKLYVKNRPERRARNLHTGEPVMVPPRAVVLFSASVSMLNAANDSVA